MARMTLKIALVSALALSVAACSKKKPEELPPPPPQTAPAPMAASSPISSI